MRLLKLFLLLGLFATMFLWVRSAEENNVRIKNYSSKTYENRSDNIESTSIRKAHILKPISMYNCMLYKQ